MLDEMAAVHLRQSAEAERDRWKDFGRAAVECVLWSCLGMACIGWAHFTSQLCAERRDITSTIASAEGFSP